MAFGVCPVEKYETRYRLPKIESFESFVDWLSGDFLNVYSSSDVSGEMLISECEYIDVYFNNTLYFGVEQQQLCLFCSVGVCQHKYYGADCVLVGLTQMFIMYNANTFFISSLTIPKINNDILLVTYGDTNLVLQNRNSGIFFYIYKMSIGNLSPTLYNE